MEEGRIEEVSTSRAVVVVVVYCLKVFKYMTVTSCCSFAFITTLSGKKNKKTKNDSFLKA